jgi:hypothetical protein
MKEADPMGLPQERLFHCLEMAAKAHAAARGPNTEVRVRNLYVFVAKSWEMLAMDEIDKLRNRSRAAESQQERRARGASSRAGERPYAR